MPQSGGGYTADPTHIRITCEVGFDPQTGRVCHVEWFVDGADDDGNSTEPCWPFDTREEALAAVQEFIDATTKWGGVTWRWNANRPRRPLTGATA